MARQLANTNEVCKKVSCNYLQLFAITGFSASVRRIEGSNFQPPRALWNGADCSGLVRIAAVGPPQSGVIRSWNFGQLRFTAVYSGFGTGKESVRSGQNGRANLERANQLCRLVPIAAVWCRLPRWRISAGRSDFEKQ